MSKQDCIKVVGVIIEALGNDKYRVELENKHVILAHTSGKMRLHNIRVMPGDQVELEMSPYDLSIGRIIYRCK